MSHLSIEQLRQWRDAPNEADRAATASHLAECRLCTDRYAEFLARPADDKSSFGTATWWALAALAVAVAIAGWQTFEMRRMRGALAMLEADRDARTHQIARLERDERAQRDALDRQLQEERKTRAALEHALAQQRDATDSRRVGAPSRPVLSLFLMPGQTRTASESKSITITQANADVRLMLSLDDQRTFRGHAVNILDSDGSSVWALSGIAPGQKVVSVRVPASVLVKDDYELVLTGIGSAGESERVGNYYFSVLK
jgi:hypothetical protein